MKEDLNIVENEYQMLTTMWTMWVNESELHRCVLANGPYSGYVISQIPSQLICTRGKTILSDERTMT
jgi:hypothetical protein